MTVRTRRVAIDQGGTGNNWGGNRGSFVQFGDTDHVQFTLPDFSVHLGGTGVSVNTVTLWSAGLLSIGPATDAQIAFMNSGESPIPGPDNAGFPGLFFLVDYTPGVEHFSYSYGIGTADYYAPFTSNDALPAAFFTFNDSFQIILDAQGFSILNEGSGSNSAINGYYIGSQQFQASGAEIEFAYYPDFLRFDGTSNADVIVGTDYDDVFYGSAGADSIDARDGAADELVFTYSPAGVSVNLATGTGSGGFAEGDQFSGIDDLVGSSFADTLIGNASANRLYGLDGNDTIAGGAGADFIDGGAGADNLDGGSGSPSDIDYLSYGSSPERVIVSLSDNTASGGDATGDTIRNFESVGGSSFNDVLFGSPGRNVLDGQGGDDVIFGFDGADDLSGGDGNDFLEGGAGGDHLSGGQGIDTLRYVGSPSGITINLETNAASGGDAAGDTFFGAEFENVIGSEFADSITGNALDNRLEGGAGNDLLFGRAGNDVLIGGAGADTMSGGQGNDVFFFDSAGDTAVEAAGEGYDTVLSSVSLTLSANIERGIVDSAAGTAAIDLTGNGLANELTGNGGRNVIDGRGGADLMTGYGGDDVYFVDDAGDTIIEAAGAGYDTVLASISYTLAANVERVATLDPSSTAKLNFTANILDNEMTGNAGANILDGGSGADLMIGGPGDDIYFVDNTGDIVSEAPDGGYDTVFTTTNFLLDSRIERVIALDNNSTTHTTLSGNEFANEITGNSGNNLIDGRGGSDILMGGLGADAFRFSTALGAGNVDALADYAVGTDKIYLDHTIFSALGTGALSADAFRVGSAAMDADDRIIYDAATGALYYDADGNGAGAAVQFAVVHEGLSLTAADFAVI